MGNLPSSQNPQPVVAKHVVKFSCYPRLQLAPRRISMGIRTERDVDVMAVHSHEAEPSLLPRDHALHAFMRYRTAEPSVATVDEGGRLHGASLGHTLLTGTLDHPDLRGLGEEERREFGLQDVVRVKRMTGKNSPLMMTTPMCLNECPPMPL